jgi:hypothetical protein
MHSLLDPIGTKFLNNWWDMKEKKNEFLNSINRNTEIHIPPLDPDHDYEIKLYHIVLV